MDKEFVNYEIALALKELGFDEPSFKAYDSKGVLQKCTSDYWDISSLNRINEATTSNLKVLAPTFSQCFKFFREKYNLHAEVKVEDCVKLGEEKYYWDIFGVYESIEGTPWIRCLEDSNGVKSNNYEEAETACLLELIKIVKKK